jgi:hypothetical protein
MGRGCGGAQPPPPQAGAPEVTWRAAVHELHAGDAQGGAVPRRHKRDPRRRRGAARLGEPRCSQICWYVRSIASSGATDRLQQPLQQLGLRQRRPSWSAAPTCSPLQQLGVPPTSSSATLSRRGPRPPPPAAAPARQRRQRLPLAPPPRQGPSPVPVCAPARARVRRASLPSPWAVLRMSVNERYVSRTLANHDLLNKISRMRALFAHACTFSGA